ncbi:MAG: response regulator [Chloroflexi bacterium]|nr:response regulator [Chloroflexota bacterium]MCI0579499.1 response regulator [Chloroflexota bacterium]MCI0650202.1 response regulator [Chloroflexota bacterium]MCI0729487.1 response regulator [Chloroflexota bacterium]
MLKILIAEDEPDIRELITLTLQFSGYEVVSAKDGVEAVEVAQADKFDLILMDVRMPRMTGYEACRQLRAIETTKHIPIIFLSAKGQESEVQAGLDAGADQYILKPFAPDLLSRKIREVLGKQ